MIGHCAEIIAKIYKILSILKTIKLVLYLFREKGFDQPKRILCQMFILFQTDFTLITDNG